MPYKANRSGNTLKRKKKKTFLVESTYLSYDMGAQEIVVHHRFTSTSLPVTRMASFYRSVICCWSLHILCSVHGHMLCGFNSPGTHEERDNPASVFFFLRKTLDILCNGVFSSKNKCCSTENDGASRISHSFKLSHPPPPPPSSHSIS